MLSLAQILDGRERAHTRNFVLTPIKLNANILSLYQFYIRVSESILFFGGIDFEDKIFSPQSLAKMADLIPGDVRYVGIDHIAHGKFARCGQWSNGECGRGWD